MLIYTYGIQVKKKDIYSIDEVPRRCMLRQDSGTWRDTSDFPSALLTHALMHARTAL
jgi:hypothetical protein